MAVVETVILGKAGKNQNVAAPARLSELMVSDYRGVGLWVALAV
jgi:hypothetical protein